MSLEEKVKTSIERIQRFADIADTYSPDGKAGYYLAFSGGKDSIVTKRLLDMAGVKYDAHYRVTSVDPPELVRFIKEYHPDVEREIPRYEPGGAANQPGRGERFCDPESPASRSSNRAQVEPGRIS